MTLTVPFIDPERFILICASPFSPDISISCTRTFWRPDFSVFPTNVSRHIAVACSNGSSA